MIRQTKPFLKLSIYIIVLTSLLNCAPNPKIESVPKPESVSKSVDQDKPTVKEPSTPAPSPLKVYRPKKVVLEKPGNQYFYFMKSLDSRNNDDLAMAVNDLKKAIQADPHSIYLQKELVLLYLNQKDETNTLKMVEALLKKKPDDLEALILAARVKQVFNQPQGAKEIYEKIIRLDPLKKNIYLMLGQQYTEENDLKNALRVYKNFTKQFPKSYAGYFFLGRTLAQQRKTKAAIAAFKKTLKLEPGLEEPLWELIKLYQSQGSAKKVEKTYLKILKSDAQNIGAAMGLGYFYYKNKKFKQSGRILKLLGRRSLKEPAITRKLIQNYIERQHHTQALVIIRGMLKGVPHNSELNYIAATVYHLEKKDTIAIRYFDKVKPDSDFYTDAVIQIAFILQNKGNVDEAIRRIEKVVKTASDKPAIMLYLGGMYEEKEDYERAAKVLKQGLALASDNTKLHFRLGVVYDKQGLKQASIETMKHVIGLDPKHHNALNYLGYTYTELGENLDEAELLITRALKIKPDDGYITDSLGWVHYKKGNYDTALQFLQKAAALVPDDPIILEHLGDAYMKMNTPDKALKYYRRSLSKRKNDKSIIKEKIQKVVKHLSK
ncbi:tetratricopeptide repeat protein [Desulfococcaceae bacterium HSG7]|nr:tetratricopeptide repeat protein [Desulfococcaceae bacterium HSG7]